MGICGSSLEPLNPDEVDLSHFVQGKTVGKGGFGTVTLVYQRDAKTGEAKDFPIYAMKRQTKHLMLQNPKTADQNVAMLKMERFIMLQANELKSNFLTTLRWCFQSPTEVFIVMDFLQGGDLRYHMMGKGDRTSSAKSLVPLPEDVVKFYVAEILLGLETLHKMRVVYRDLKPNNALLDSKGHLRLSDFGVSDRLEEKHNYQSVGASGTPGYVSPEMLKRIPYGIESDFWTLGIMMFEMLHGCRPYAEAVIPRPSTKEQFAATEELVNKHFASAPPVNKKLNLSNECVSFMNGLLTVDPTKRLGCLPIDPKNWEREVARNWSIVKKHSWFASIDFDRLSRHELPPLIKPEKDVANCTADAEAAFLLMDNSNKDLPKVSPEDDIKYFKGIEYNTHDPMGTIGGKKSRRSTLSSSSATNTTATTTTTTTITTTAPTTTAGGAADDSKHDADGRNMLSFGAHTSEIILTE